MAEAVATGIAPEQDEAPALREDRIPAGWRVIAGKEFTDHLLSIRFLLLLLLLGVIGVFSIYSVSGIIRDLADQITGAPALFLALFSQGSAPSDNVNVPSFVGFVALLGPLLGIVFGFDAVSAERSEGTLPRLVSQPIHRDDVINGKFLSGLAVIVLIIVAVMLLIAGVGLIQLGIVPSLDETLRLITWVGASVIYVGFWLAFATLCSVVFQRAATAALVTISTWLIFGLFWGLIAPLVSDVLAPGAGGSVGEQVARATLADNINRISPVVLFQELSRAVLDPTVRWLGVVTVDQLDRATVGALPLQQSLLIAWPQAVAIIAETVICFAIAYIVFMRQEVRA